MERPRTLLLSAGEASGDLHAGTLADAIRRCAPDVALYGMGGQRMRDAGVELLIDIGSSSVMGLVEVARQIPEFLRKRRRLRDWIDAHRPDAVVLVDFPDFHLPLAAAAKRMGVPVIYYIPPKAWAWRRGRAAKVADVAALVLSILPFEAVFYEAQRAHVRYVGHPLVDIVRRSNPLSRDAARRRFGIAEDAVTIGLLPGSRKGEIERLMMPMLDAAARVREAVPALDVVVPLAPTVTDAMLTEAMTHPVFEAAKVVRGATYDAIRACDLLLAASGTVTLEAAILGVPMVVVYRLAPVTYAVVRRLVRVRYSALPNLLADRRIVPELYQRAVSPERMAKAAVRFLTQPELRERQRQELAHVTELLGTGGAVERAAAAVLEVAYGKRT